MIHLTESEMDFFNEHYKLVENRRSIEEYCVIPSYELSRYINDSDSVYDLETELIDTYYDESTSEYNIERKSDGRIVESLDNSSDIEELKTKVQALIQKEMRAVKGAQLQTEPLFNITIEINPPDDNNPLSSTSKVWQTLSNAGHNDIASEICDRLTEKKPHENILDILKQYVHIKLKEVV